MGMDMDQIPQPQLAARLVARLQDLLIAKDFEYAEALTALVACLIGMWWLFPAKTFEIPAYDIMAQQAPEWIWGLIVLSLGIAQFIALLYDHLEARRRCCMALAVLYGAIASEVSFANFASTNVIFFFAFCASALWAYWRMGLLTKHNRAM